MLVSIAGGTARRRGSCLFCGATHTGWRLGMRQSRHGRYGRAIMFDACYGCVGDLLDLLGLVMVDGYPMRLQDAPLPHG